MDNLSAEMIQCKRDGFGCHYGAWKALQKNPIVPVKKEKFERACEYCGKEIFKYAHKGKRFCCPKCASLAGYYRNREQILSRIKEKKQKKGIANES